jgi:hypothetical protein
MAIEYGDHIARLATQHLRKMPRLVAGERSSLPIFRRQVKAGHRRSLKDAKDEMKS